MAVVFDRASAKITPDFKTAKPDCFIGSQRVFFHLTEGFDSSKICDRGHRHALAANGSIGLSANPTDLKGWNFGFIQVARANNMSKFYLGRTRKEGSIVLQTHIPPTLPKAMLLDGSSTANPWIRFSEELHPVIETKQMLTDMGDHPSACAEKILPNTLTKCENLLFHHITEYELWTTLCARDPAGVFQQFAHFHWVLRWDQKFIWRGREMMKGRSSSFITNDNVVLGPPADPAVQAILKTPLEPVAVQQFNWANNSFQKMPPNYIANDDWFLNAPVDFFAPS